MESKRITLIDHEDLVLDLEYNEYFAILHLPKMKMNRTTYTDFLVTVPQVFEFVQTFGFVAIHTAIAPNDTVTKKLVSRLGATYLGSADGLDVYEYRGEA